ncbi:MAG TPA: S41 family peptidase [Phycisphaerales bacterium]|nr:S41 family peptidase [Phycisphaerales bacterium]
MRATVKTLLSLVLVTLLGGAAAADVAPIPNGDFSKGAEGTLPDGWVLPTTALGARVSGTGGDRAVELKLKSRQAGGTGNFMQSVDATPYRGKNVILRFRLRATDPTSKGEGRAQPWVRVDRQNEVQGWFDNCHDRPVRPTDGDAYQTVALAGRIDDDATALNLGVLVFAPAAATVKSVTIEEGELKTVDAPPAPLSDRGLANLRAFAQMYGQVKYFHPSDEAFRADWNVIAAKGARRAEPCADAAELARTLADVFAGVGVGIQVWAGSEAPAAPPAPTDGRITGWQHAGVGFGPEFTTGSAGRSIYKSTRIRESVKVDGERRLPPPGTFATGSEAGVSWRIPVSLALDADLATTPKAAGSPLADARPEGSRPSGNDRVTRIGDVVIAWNLFHHFYPYFDAVKTDWNATLTRSLKSAATDADAAAFLVTLRRLVGDLHDGHGNVSHADLRPRKALPSILMFLGSDLVASRPIDGSALKPGDRIIRIDGRTPAELLAEWRPQTSAATEQWARYAIARGLPLYAPSADPSSVTVERDGAETTISIPLVAFEKLAPLRSAGRPADGTVVGKADGAEKSDIIYFNLDGGKNESLTAVVDTLKDAAGIVFDLRGYPDSAATTVLRHLTDENIQSARWIIPSVTLPGNQNGGGWKWTERGRWNLPPAQPRLGGPSQPVVFITDGRAISYAESIMGIVEAYKLGEIVGGPTAGTNGNVNPFTLPGGYTLSWTGMRVMKHDGSPHHGVAIAPTVPCEPTPAGLAAGRDELLEKAVEVIRSKRAE